MSYGRRIRQRNKCSHGVKPVGWLLHHNRLDGCAGSGYQATSGRSSLCSVFCHCVSVARSELHVCEQSVGFFNAHDSLQISTYKPHTRSITPQLSVAQSLAAKSTAAATAAAHVARESSLCAIETILVRNLAIICHNPGLPDQFMAPYTDLFEWVRPKAGAVAFKFITFQGPRTSDQLGQELAASGISVKPSYYFTEVVTEDVDYF
jgi:hypothetical protein